VTFGSVFNIVTFGSVSVVHITLTIVRQRKENKTKAHQSTSH
jgi:hypothetical protein